MKTYYVYSKRNNNFVEEFAGSRYKAYAWKSDYANIRDDQTLVYVSTLEYHTAKEYYA